MLYNDLSTNSGRSRCFARIAVIGLAIMLSLTACGSRQEQTALNDDEAVAQQNEKASEYMRLGNSLRAQGNLIDAAEMYRRAARADTNSPLPPAALGDTLRQLKRYQDAEAVYRNALERNPYSGLALQGYGILLIETGQPDTAITLLTPAVDEDTADHRVYNVLGIAYDALGDHTQAQNQYLAGLELAPDNNSLRNNIALSMVLQDRYDAAIEQIQRMLTGTKNDEAYLHNLALVYGLAGRIESAGSLLRQMLPEADVANNLAYYQNLRAMTQDERRAALLNVILSSIFLTFDGTGGEELTPARK